MTWVMAWFLMFLMDSKDKLIMLIVLSIKAHLPVFINMPVIGLLMPVFVMTSIPMVKTQMLGTLRQRLIITRLKT